MESNFPPLECGLDLVSSLKTSTWKREMVSLEWRKLANEQSSLLWHHHHPKKNNFLDMVFRLGHYCLKGSNGFSLYLNKISIPRNTWLPRLHGLTHIYCLLDPSSLSHYGLASWAFSLIQYFPALSSLPATSLRSCHRLSLLIVHTLLNTRLNEFLAT